MLITGAGRDGGLGQAFALAAGTGKPWSVLIGGTLALWAVSLIAILLGGTVLRRIPKSWMHRVAAVLFLGFGAIAVAQALTTAGT